MEPHGVRAGKGVSSGCGVVRTAVFTCMLHAGIDTTSPPIKLFEQDYERVNGRQRERERERRRMEKGEERKKKGARRRRENGGWWQHVHEHPRRDMLTTRLAFCAKVKSHGPMAMAMSGCHWVFSVRSTKAGSDRRQGCSLLSLSPQVRDEDVCTEDRRNTTFI